MEMWYNLLKRRGCSVVKLFLRPAAPPVFGRGSGLRCGFGFAFGKSFGVPSIYSLGNRLRTLGTSLGNRFTTLHPRLFNRLYHSNKISTVQFGIQLCHTDPCLSCSFSTLNPRADIDRWDFHSVHLFTVEIWNKLLKSHRGCLEKLHPRE